MQFPNYHIMKESICGEFWAAIIIVCIVVSKATLQYSLNYGFSTIGGMNNEA